MKDTIIEKLATLRQKENQYHDFLDAFIGTLVIIAPDDIWEEIMKLAEEYCKKHKKEK